MLLKNRSVITNLLTIIKTYTNTCKNIQSLLEKRGKHALNNVVEGNIIIAIIIFLNNTTVTIGIVDELLILRNEVVDYRIILSTILASVKDIPGAEYQQIVELLKRHIVPDDALQQELLAFKRYFIHEKKDIIIGAEKTRMTGNDLIQITFSTDNNINTNRTTSCLQGISSRCH